MYLRSLTAVITPPSGITGAYDQRVTLGWLQAATENSNLINVLPNSTTQAVWTAAGVGANVTISVPNVRLLLPRCLSPPSA